MLVKLIIISFIQISNGLLNEAPYFMGTYLLRKTNDESLMSSYTYLILNDNNNIKLKSIIQNGPFATKISRTGSLKFINNLKTIFNPMYHITFNKKLNDIIVDNDVNLLVTFNNVNKYSYSVLGIEFPELKYKQISNYNINKKIRVRQKNYTLYVTDDKYYYLFDLNSELIKGKLPYVEIPFNTLLFTQIFGFIINILLVKFFDII
jgi:hypothetical protein